MNGQGRIGEVVDSQALKHAAAAAAAIEEAALLVYEDRVRAAGTDVVHGVRERHDAGVDLGEIEYLNAATALADCIGVVAEGADVAPKAGRADGGAVEPGSGNNLGVVRVGHFNHAHAAGEADEGVLAAGGRDIALDDAGAGKGGVEVGHGDPTQQLDVGGREG